MENRESEIVEFKKSTNDLQEDVKSSVLEAMEDVIEEKNLSSSYTSAKEAIKDMLKE